MATKIRAGQINIDADLPMNGHKLSGLGAASSNGDAVRYEQMLPRTLGLDFSDDTTPLTAVTNVLTFHFPYTTTIGFIWIELKTAQASGAIFTVDVNKNGSTVLSTKLTIDNTEETSLTAVTAAVISSASFTKGDKITVDIDQIGNGSAIGGKIWFEG